MFDSQLKNCAFAEQAVAFLYGELEAENKTTFSSHLQNCATCREELAGFGAVRSSIFDWRTQEFNLLENPSIVIETERKTQNQNAAVQSSQTVSWLDEIRRIFTLSPAFTAVAALLLFTVCAGLIAYNFSGERQIAEVKNKRAEERTNVSAGEKNVIEQPDFENNGGKAEKQSVAVSSPEPDIVDNNADNNVDNKNAAPVNAGESDAKRKILKVADEERAVVKKELTARKIRRSPDNSKIARSNSDIARYDAPASARRVPKLSNIEDEDEETSLRLTDLLGDAGGK